MPSAEDVRPAARAADARRGVDIPTAGDDGVFYTGIAWSSLGYEVAVVDATGTHTAPDVHVTPNLWTLIEYLESLRLSRKNCNMAVAIDSSNGMVDGTLMTAGFDVYRADPWHVGALPTFGSASALSLAEVSRQNLRALTRLQIKTGTLTGRIHELNNGILRSRKMRDVMTMAGRCISHGSRHLRQIALTFDDGPHPKYTHEVIDILERYEIKATFFCVGANISAFPDAIQRMADLGHEIGNHTWSHPYLPDLNPQQLTRQIEETSTAIHQIAQCTPTFFRPPYGSQSPALLSSLLIQDVIVALWDIEPLDWAMPGATQISGRVLGGAQPGSVVLMHDGGGDRSQTVAALPEIIEGLLEMGYELVTVSALANASQRRENL